ncbi:unnamed protein product [Fusarium venenatum]|uniref:Heterokaryon incompatibility domain-containing protein n=1 Tax=Fusarium venenatum TaxID=56646 RepID=A0A2L2SYZ9_9HYPO|nr:uncharacterized protein FVRRES_04579 [Fusarium venenatum]KAH6991737.1 hypothetical protein EDB82DRAFT_121225 [Fusarium venenatum]CEI60143.1 unnamed protein product [Fusarium venenatum]
MIDQGSGTKAIQNYPHPPVKPQYAKCFSPWHRRHTAYNFGWYKTIAEVHEYAIKGCGICLQLLRTGTYSFYQDSLELVKGFCGQMSAYLSLDKAFWTVSARFYCYEDLSHYGISVDERKEVKKKWSAIAYPFSYSSPEHEYLEKITDDSRITCIMALCKEWLAKFDLDHECRDVSKIHPEALPTSLVNIDGDGARLCPDTSLMPTSTNYATLSHCWGLKKFLALNKSNISGFCGCIPFNSLTKTFRKAIVIARSLGFKYIWIDSLCIIQDDALD